MSISLSVIPDTLEAAVEYIFHQLTDADVLAVKEHGAQGAHFWFGMNLRNAWDLWGAQGVKSGVRDDITKRFALTHGDDLSGMILYGLEARCRGQEPDYVTHAQVYHDHWALMGPL